MATAAEWASQEEKNKELFVILGGLKKRTCAIVDTPCSRPLFALKTQNVNATSEIFINQLSIVTRAKK